MKQEFQQESVKSVKHDYNMESVNFYIDYNMESVKLPSLNSNRKDIPTGIPTGNHEKSALSSRVKSVSSVKHL